MAGLSSQKLAASTPLVGVKNTYTFPASWAPLTATAELRFDDRETTSANEELLLDASADSGISKAASRPANGRMSAVR
jgi:hypothetical protein